MKRSLLLMASVLVILMLAACGGEKVDDATAEKFIAKAETVVGLLNDGKNEDVHAMFDEIMKEGLPVRDIEQLTPFIEQSGKFEKVNKSSIEESNGVYVIVLAVNYSEENRIYTISFNEEEEIAGLYMK